MQLHTKVCVQAMNDDASGPLSKFRKVKRDASLVLARLATESGVKHFVFQSQIEMNGEMTRLGLPFTLDDMYVPDELCGLSRYEAELGLLGFA